MVHVSVMADEVVAYLDPKPNQVFIDCTLGDGGHTGLLLAKVAPDGKVLGIDLDPEAIMVARENLEAQGFADRMVLAHGNFADIGAIAKEQGFTSVDGILLDLGFSSRTLERGKGFSFQTDEPLDMRYNPDSDFPTAAEIVNSKPKAELVEIFEEFGEERQATMLADAIVKARKRQRILTTGELATVIVDAYRAKLKSKKEIPWLHGIHPATRTFQALRIYVNHELENLETLLEQVPQLLKPKGRIAVITFHSLEDRIVKQFFKTNEALIKLTKKPLIPSKEEQISNPRSRSSKLRVAQKIS